VDKDRVLTDYLLGKLDDSASEAVEQQYFASPEALEALTALEEQLFDDYAANKLHADDRVRFERRFLKTDADRTHVAFVRTVMDWTRHVRRPKPLFNFSWWPEVEAVMAQESVQPGKIQAKEHEGQVLLVEIPSNGLLEIEVDAGASMAVSHLLLMKNNEGKEIWRSEMTLDPATGSLKAHVPCSLLSEDQVTVAVYSQTDAHLDPLVELAMRFRKRPSA